MPYMHFKCTYLQITVCGILIKRDCLEMFELLRIWSISQYLCSWPLLPLPLFCLCALPPWILLLFFLVCWPCSFSGCSSTVRICNSCVVLCLYAFQLKVHEMQLWAISENWYIIGWSIFSSFTIQLHNSWQIYKKSKRNVENICLTVYEN